MSAVVPAGLRSALYEGTVTHRRAEPVQPMRADSGDAIGEREAGHRNAEGDRDEGEADGVRLVAVLGNCGGRGHGAH